VFSTGVMNVILLIVGIAALMIGGEVTVRYSVKLAEALRIPTLIVGLTIVAIGTSLPEMAVGITGVIAGNGGIVMGNIVGTNIVNVLLILGLSALIRPIAVPNGVLSFDLPIMVGACGLLWLLAVNGHLAVWNGALLLLLGIIYMAVVVITARKRPTASEMSHDFTDENQNGIRDDREDAERLTPGRMALTVLLLLAGLAIIKFGADWMLSGAVGIAEALGVSQTMIGLTIVAMGTSAPELVTMMVATIRNERGLAFGTIIGSSTLNLTIVLGTGLLFAHPAVDVDWAMRYINIPVMILVGIICVPVFFTGKRVSRWEGGLFVALYGVYLAYTILDATRGFGMPA